MTTTPEITQPGTAVAKRVDVLTVLIKQHPLAAIGIGFGLGYLLARLVNR